MRILLLLLLVAPSAARAQEATWAARAGQIEVSVTTVKSAGGAAIRVHRGRLAVPERRDADSSRLIDIGFARLESRARGAHPTLFFLQGGPGSAATGAVDHPQALELWNELLDDCEVVLIDQRGTRDPDLRYTWDGPLPLTFFTDAGVANAHMAAMARRAAEAFRERGIDLAGYTVDESVADLDDLRAAFGLERIALLGFSYGTHLALQYMRAHEARVSRAVLIGIEGPDHTVKLPLTMDVQFARLSRMAAADPAIAGTIPDLEALLDRVDATLARAPMRVTIPGPDGRPNEIPVGPFGLHFIMRADIGDATDLPVFPRLLHSIDRGDPAVLAWFIEKRAGVAIRVHGMSAMTDASSGASAARDALVASQAAVSRFEDVVNFPDLRPVWSPAARSRDYHAPLVSRTPTLFVSGALDWNSPPHQAEEVRWGFSDAVHLVVPNAGHEQTFWQNPDAVPVVRDFLRGKDVSNAKLTYPPLRFVPLEGPAGAVTHPSVR